MELQFNHGQLETFNANNVMSRNQPEIL